MGMSARARRSSFTPRSTRVCSRQQPCHRGTCSIVRHTGGECSRSSGGRTEREAQKWLSMHKRVGSSPQSTCSSLPHALPARPALRLHSTHARPPTLTTPAAALHCSGAAGSQPHPPTHPPGTAPPLPLAPTTSPPPCARRTPPRCRHSVQRAPAAPPHHHAPRHTAAVPRAYPPSCRERAQNMMHSLSGQ